MRPPSVAGRADEVALLQFFSELVDRSGVTISTDGEALLGFVSMIEVVHKRWSDIPTVHAFTSSFGDECGFGSSPPCRYVFCASSAHAVNLLG
jgi:hypothetical protein